MPYYRLPAPLSYFGTERWVVMELFALQCFMTLVEEKKFSSAAEKLHLSQSSFSKTISGLEDEVGARLFDRTAQGTVLSEAGKLLLPYVRNILSACSTAEERLDSFHVQETKSIHLYTHAYLTSYGLQHFLYIYKNENPDVDVVFHECDTVLALTEIGKSINRVGIVFTFPSLIQEYSQTHSLHFIPLMHDDIVAIMHEGHPLAGSDLLSAEQLRDQAIHIISERQDPALHQFLSEELNARGLRFEDSYFNLWATTVNLLIANKNMIYLTARCIADLIIEESEGLVLCPLKGISPIEVSVAGTSEHSDFAPLERFYSFARNYSSAES